MRKLFLASFTFERADKTGDFTEQRIIAVESIVKNNKTEQEWLDKAYDIARKHVDQVEADTEARYKNFIVYPTLSETLTG